MFSKQLSTYLISLTFLTIVIMKDVFAAPIPSSSSESEILIKRAEFGMPPPVFYNQQNYSPAIYHDQSGSRKSNTKHQSRKSTTVKSISSLLSGEKRPSIDNGGGINKSNKNHSSLQPKKHSQQQQQQPSSSERSGKLQWTGMSELRKTIPRSKSMSENWWKQNENDEQESPKHHRTSHNHRRKH